MYITLLAAWWLLENEHRICRTSRKHKISLLNFQLSSHLFSVIFFKISIFVIIYFDYTRLQIIACIRETINYQPVSLEIIIYMHYCMATNSKSQAPRRKVRGGLQLWIMAYSTESVVAVIASFLSRLYRVVQN